MTCTTIIRGMHRHLMTHTTIRVGQTHTFIGIYGVHTVFLAGESTYIRSIHGADIRFWPTLITLIRGMHCHSMIKGVHYIS